MTETTSNSDTSITLTINEKLRLLDSLIKDLVGPSPSTALDIDVSYEPIKQSDPDTLCSYYIPGSTINRKTQNSNLIMKLDQMSKQQRKQQQAQQDKIDLSGSEEQNSYYPEDNFRYFKDNIICFRCQKPGHYKSVCPETLACLFCLSSAHLTDLCPQKNVCYRCYGFGHIIGECMMEGNPSRCFRCDRNHTGQCYFLTKGKERTKKMFKLDELYNDPKIRCAKCLEYGHIQCDRSTISPYSE